MLKRRPGSIRDRKADNQPVPSPYGATPGMPPDEFLVETDLSADRKVTDAELEAIIRLLGEDLARLLG